MILQLLRRSCQALVLVLIGAVAVLSLYAHYRAARAIDDPQLMAGLRGEAITMAIHPAIQRLDDPQTFLDNYKGTLWSMKLGGISLTDPLAAAETIAASKHIHVPMMISILIPIALTLLLGKVFCSWICPGYLLFELTGKLRGLLRLAEIPPGKVKFSLTNKYVFLLVGLALAAVTSAPLFSLIYPPAVISRVMHAWIFGTALTGMLILLAVMVAFEMFVSPRWWCRTMCPGGALYGLIGWIRPLRVRLAADQCTGCADCIPVCEAGINPITQSESIECDNCGVCIRHCPEKVLYFTIGLPRRQAALPPRRHGDDDRSRQGTPAAAAVVLGALLLPLLMASPASGHHILGLPHYSYKDNYPQRPTLEYPATTGPYDVLLTSYPGLPVPGEPANLAFYIKNRTLSKVYDAPVTVRVIRTSTFGDNEIILGPRRLDPFDNQHKFQCVFEHEGEYIVELTMDVEGQPEVIPFLMTVGNPTATASIVAAGTFALMIGLVTVRAVQKKRQRRRQTPLSSAGSPPQAERSSAAATVGEA